MGTLLQRRGEGWAQRISHVLKVRAAGMARGLAPNKLILGTWEPSTAFHESAAPARTLLLTLKGGWRRPRLYSWGGRGRGERLGGTVCSLLQEQGSTLLP